MTFAPRDDVAPGPPDRPTAARPPRRSRLGTQLAASIAISVATVIGVLTIVGMRLAERQLDADLREAARLTAVALADDIELRPEPIASEALVPLLRDFMNAAVDLSAISVFNVEDGRAVPVVGTSVVSAPPIAVVQQAIATRQPAWSEEVPHTAIIAVPVFRGDDIGGAVAVAVSLTTVEQLRRTAGLIAVSGAIFGMAGITLLIHLRARRLILEPLAEIRKVIARARHGDLASRATLDRDNELKEVADGLNVMLAELDSLNKSLNQRVSAATLELRDRNAQLVRSYESVLQLRETAARAEQLAAVGQTMANVAHQIGTPLNLVSGHVQLLKQAIVDPALQRRLTIVQEQIERVASTVRDLLERARPRTDRRAVSVGTILGRLGEMLRARLAATGVILEQHIAPDLADVAADETQLELALLNLVTNAIDAMPDGGTLIVAATPGAHGVRIQVRDTGTGIAPDVLAKVFDPWVTTKPAGRGNGLGLSITQEVITRLGGTITVASTPGEGATFTIDLPAAEAALQAS
jgi:two-component system NtrC family sensor kinase